MYQCHNAETDEMKRSSKGVPHRTRFEMDTFKSVLLDENAPQTTVQLNSLRKNKNQQMTHVTLEKKALSDIFLKLQVQPDKITCKPLTLNNKYL